MFMQRLSAVLLIVALGAGCAGQTISKTEAQGELVAVQGLDLAVTTYGILKANASPRCAAGGPVPGATLCKQLRLFGEGADPKSTLCSAPQMDQFSAVQEKCGFEVSAQLALAAYKSGAGIAQQTAAEVANLITQLNGFVKSVGVK